MLDGDTLNFRLAMLLRKRFRRLEIFVCCIQESRFTAQISKHDQFHVMAIDQMMHEALYAPRTFASRATSEGLLAVRGALAAKQKLRIHYVTKDGVASDLIVWPLGAFFWGRSWTVTTWCELRKDFRNFRLDRIESIEATGETFPEDPERSLRQYLLSIGVEADG